MYTKDTMTVILIKKLGKNLQVIIINNKCYNILLIFQITFDK